MLLDHEARAVQRRELLARLALATELAVGDEDPHVRARAREVATQIRRRLLSHATVPS